MKLRRAIPRAGATAVMRRRRPLALVLLFATVFVASGALAKPWLRQDRPGARLALTMHGRAVVDRETDLVWLREPQSPFFVSLRSAHTVCTNLFVGDRRGWRLPLAHELTSLIGNGFAPGHPFIGLDPADVFWTGSVVLSGGQAFVSLVMANGSVQSSPDPDVQSARIWCVRGSGSGLESG